MKLPSRRLPAAAAALALVVGSATLAGCATRAPGVEAASAGAPDAPAAQGVASPRSAATAPGAGSGARAGARPSLRDADPEDVLPDVDLTAQVLYQLLASEIAVQRGQNSAAAASYLQLARQTRDPRIARRAVELALTERSLERAAAAAQIWLETSPDSRMAAQTLEALYLTNGRYALAEPLLAKRLAIARETGTLASVYPALARTLMRSPDRGAAFALIERVAAPDDELPEAWLARAALAHAADDFAFAVQAGQRAMQLAPESEEATLATARYLQRTPDGTKPAIDLLERFLARRPASQETRVTLARLHGAEGDFARARGHLDQALASSPQDPALLFSLAQVAYQSKQPREAEQYLQRRLALPPSVRRDDGLVYVFLAQIAEEDKRLPQAIDWLGRVEKGEQYLPALARRALLLGRLDRVDDARALLRDASVAAPGDRVQLVLAESQILRDAARHQEAFDVVDAALSLQPSNADLLYEHGLAAERTGRHAEMEGSLRKLMQLRPDSAHAYNALGYSLADRNERLPEALQLIEKALSLAPDDAFILDSMGWVYFRMGRLDQALQYLQRAYGLRQDVEIAAHLGEVLWALGRTEEARRLWRDAREREPDNGTLKGTLARLNVSF